MLFPFLSALPNSEQLKAVVDYHGEDEVGGGIHDKVEINGDGSHHEHGNAVTEDSHHGPHYFGWNDMGSSEVYILLLYLHSPPVLSVLNDQNEIQ